MRQSPLPYALEDTSGRLTLTDFDDIYDRIFLRVAQSPQPTGRTTLMIYNMHRRSSRRRDSLPFRVEPSVVLRFGANNALGDITFLQSPARFSVPMNRYLQKTATFGSSLSRKFSTSDNNQFRWVHRSVQGQEWSCLTSEGCLVAHYDLKPQDTRVYGVSGNVFTIYEAFAHLAIELLASLTIMRHIAEHNL